MKKYFLYGIFLLIGLFIAIPTVFATESSSCDFDRGKWCCQCVCGSANREFAAGTPIFYTDYDMDKVGDWNLAVGPCPTACLDDDKSNLVPGVGCFSDEGAFGWYYVPYCDTCECLCRDSGGSCSVSSRYYPSSSEPGKMPKNNSESKTACRDLCDSQSGCTYRSSNCTVKDHYDFPGAGEVTSPEAEPTVPPPEPVELEPPFGQAGQEPVSYIRSIIGTIIQWSLSIVGSIALLMFVIGGFIWLT
jgi:hypothetical protein